MNTESPWNKILSAAELATYWADVAKLDPSFSYRSRTWYESRTPDELRGTRVGAWNCCDSETFQLARSYIALAMVAA